MPSTTTVTQYDSYEGGELSWRHKKVLKCVEDTPGTTKEEIIKKNPDIGSRMTIVKAINDLIEMRMLIVKRGLNRHIHHLYTNNEHEVLSLFKDLEFFKQVYFRLIDETTKQLKKLWDKSQKKSDVGRYGLMWHLLEALLKPYKNLMYITSDILLWQELPIDKETYKKFEVLYDSMKEIQIKLHESITPLITSRFYQDLDIKPLNSSLYSLQSGLSLQHIIAFLQDYWPFRRFVEPVLAIRCYKLDILWKISYPVLQIDPFYASVDREKLKDWRNIISGNEEFNYIPKTTQAKNLGILLR